MTPEERDDLEDMQASVTQIVDLVQAAERDETLSAEDAARIADIAKQTVTLMHELLTEAEEEGEAEDAVSMLRNMLVRATTAAAQADTVLARRNGGEE
ncbi:hypothetical protein [Falsirhodobacter deserti]|uniref:hypothetical protein n=1 Tax=Falsirhodobacter deserti TaxID=1365611 RepID=UPI000FE339A6|nr:hypothetical protein [Falsirhodobacter deserti]